MNKAKYVSAGLQEYWIYHKPPFYYIKAWHQAPTCFPKHMQGAFQSFKKAEDTLIAQLKKQDKWGKAIYPGKETRDAPRPD